MSDRDYRPTKPKTAVRVVVALAILIALGIAGRAKADEVRLLCAPSEEGTICVLLFIEDDDDEPETTEI